MHLRLPRTTLSLAYLGSTAAQAAAVTVIQITVMMVYLQWVNPVVYQVPVAYVPSLSLGVTTMGALYQLILTLDAYRIKNNIQIAVQCICNVCLSIATVMQYHQIKEANSHIRVGEDMYKTPFAKRDWEFWAHVSPALITCIVVSCVCSAAMCVLVVGLTREFSWKLYEQVSPDRTTRRRYVVYQVYLVLLKFTPFFLFAFIIVYNLINVHYAEPEFSLTWVIMPAALIHVGLAVYFVRQEKLFAMVVVLIGHAAEMAYLVRSFTVLYGDTPLARTLMKQEMVFFAAVALIFATAAFVAACACMFNFNKGLKPLLLGQVQRKNNYASEPAVADIYHFQNLSYSVLPPDNGTKRFELD